MDKFLTLALQWRANLAFCFYSSRVRNELSKDIATIDL